MLLSILGSPLKLHKQIWEQPLILQHLGGSKPLCPMSGEHALDCSLEGCKAAAVAHLAGVWACGVIARSSKLSTPLICMQDLFGEMPPSMPHLGGGVQYGGPHGMMVPQQQLGMPHNGPVPPFPGAQAGFMAQQMFGGFGQPSLGPPSFAQAPQQQQVAGYGGMGGLGGGPFGATAPPQAYPSDEHPSEWRPAQGSGSPLPVAASSIPCSA